MNRSRAAGGQRARQGRSLCALGAPSSPTLGQRPGVSTLAPPLLSASVAVGGPRLDAPAGAIHVESNVLPFNIAKHRLAWVPSPSAPTPLPFDALLKAISKARPYGSQKGDAAAQLTLLVKHPDAHASVTRMVQVVSLCWHHAGPPALRASLTNAVSLYLLGAPPNLLRATSGGLDALLAELHDEREPRNPLPFYAAFWELLRPQLHRDWSATQCLEAGAGVLAAAERAAANSATDSTSSKQQQQQQTTGSSATGGTANWASFFIGRPLPQSLHQAQKAQHQSYSSLLSIPRSLPSLDRLASCYAPTPAMWSLHRRVHTEVFEALAVKLQDDMQAHQQGRQDCSSTGALSSYAAASASSSAARPLPGTTTPCVSASGPPSACSWRATWLPSLAEEAAFMFPSPAQALLLAAAAFNRRAHADRVVLSERWLATAAAAALEPLPFLLTTSSQLACVMEALVELTGSCGSGAAAARHLLGPRALAALDDSLSCVVTPGSCLPSLARLMAARARLGPVPSEGAGLLVRRVNEGVMALQVNGFAEDVLGSSASGEEFGPSTPKPAPSMTVSEERETLDALGLLLELAAAPSAPAEQPRSDEQQASSCLLPGVDIDLISNKAQIMLAMASDGLWSCPDFLARVYPRLAASARRLGARPEDLMVDRYLSALSGQLVHQLVPNAAWNDVGCLAKVLAALDDGRDFSDDFQSAFQHHCARLLRAGVDHDFIREPHFVSVLQSVSGWAAPCPQLAATLAWALAHGSAPFRTGTGFQAACRAWAQMLGPEGAVAASGQVGGRAVGGGGAWSIPRSVAGLVELPGVGEVQEKGLVRCMEEGRRMGLAVPAVEEWMGVVGSRLRAVAQVEEEKALVQGLDAVAAIAAE